MLTKTQPRETIGESAYRRIRSDIIFGVLAPGQKLRLEKVSESYGTSISTLRELLNRMCPEGLIVAEGQRGFEVAPVSADDFRQVAELRLLLENHALEQSFAAGDLDWEGRVVSAHHKLAVMEKRMLEGQRQNQELWKQCDWDFHHSLISACGSDVLLAAHAAAYDRYLRYQMITVAAGMSPDTVPFQPWAKALFDQRKDGSHSREDPDANCLPQGVPKADAVAYPWKMIPTPGSMVIVYEAFNLSGDRSSWTVANRRPTRIRPGRVTPPEHGKATR